MSSSGCEVCKEPAERRCSVCKMAAYCSVEHQKEHWALHKIKCKSCKVVYSEKLGRYMVSTRDLTRGDVILAENPLVFVPKPHASALICVGCCRTLREKPNNCELCYWPACSPLCPGLTDKRRHAPECKLLRLRRDSPREGFRYDVLLVLRSLMLQKTSPEKWKSLIDMEAHLEKRGPETKTYREIDEKAEYIADNYLKALEEYEKENGPVVPIKDKSTIHKLYAIFDVNSTDISDGDIEASALYHQTSLIEHNCVPNSMQIIDEKYRMTVRAALPITQGGNITTMYTHILWGTHSRREHLLKLKYFACECNRCSDSTELGTFFGGLKCIGAPEAPCGGTQLPTNPLDFNTMWICKSCGIALPNGDVMEFVDHLGEEVEKAMREKPTVEELEKTLEKLLVFVHPHHYHAYNVKHSLVQMYGRGGFVSDGDIEKKINTSEELIGVTRTLDPGDARLAIYHGVLLIELFNGKFEQMKRRTGDVRKEEIFEILREAQDALKYETKSESGRKLNELIIDNFDMLEKFE